MSLKKQSNEHIKVFVRCRPLLQSEFGDSEPVEVHPQVNKIFVRDSGADRCTVKVFSFDKVFGPEAKQADIYAAVVAPIVIEVMKGFNCTVFAYGQTGTGKTFTIEGGKMENLQNGSEDSLCGVIPRAMKHLFKDLSGQEVEFEIYVSFLELYNEELFDLLSYSEDLVKLKMFDDSSQKGSVVVQGLKKMPVTSMAEVYAILDEGCRKRRKAATLLNQMSSRSHTIFTVTVHIKESSSTFERTRTGKLNLVDLAGSENIGRSGAIHKRAREAGSINQSLLALGRVITSLCERAVHIPYRESKLTRLLRDSLGGQTKTAVIATISPSAAHLEETLNSLEYALRAKSITNKPEVNTQVSSTSLMKDYLDEINRLKQTISNMICKTGFNIPEERIRSWKTFCAMKRDQKFQIMSQIESLTKENQSLDATLLEGNTTLVSETNKLNEERERQKRLREDLKKLKEEKKLEEVMVSVLEPVCSNLHEKLHGDLENEAAFEIEVKQMKSKAQTQLDEEQNLHQQIRDLKLNRARKTETIQSNFQDLSSKVKNMHENMQSLTTESKSYVSTLQSDYESILSLCEKEFENLFKSMKDLERINSFFHENTESLLKEAKCTKLKWMDEWEAIHKVPEGTSILDPLHTALNDCRTSLQNISEAFKECKCDLTLKADLQQKWLKDHLSNQKQTLESTTTYVNVLIGELKKNFKAYNEIIMKSSKSYEINKKLWNEHFLCAEKAISSLDIFSTEYVKNETEITTQAKSFLQAFLSDGKTLASTLTEYCEGSCQNMDELLKNLQGKDVCLDKLKGLKQDVDSCSGYKDLSTAVVKCETSFQDLEMYSTGMAVSSVSDFEKKAIDCTKNASDSLLQLGKQSESGLEDAHRKVDSNFSKNASSTDILNLCLNTLSETSEREVTAFMQCIATAKKSLSEESFEGNTCSRMSSSEMSSLSITAKQNTLDGSVFINETVCQTECPVCHKKLGDTTLKADDAWASTVSTQKVKCLHKRERNFSTKSLHSVDVENLCSQICTTWDEED